LLLLNTGALDTTRAEIQSLNLARKTPNKTASGKDEAHLQLVQFAGPIKPAWHKALLRTGVEIVNYVPNNAYLVYGEAPSLNQLQAAASISDYVQWLGAYEPPMKIAPRARVRAQSDDPRDNLYGIQLFSGVAANQATLALINALKRAPIKHQFRIARFHNIIVELPPTALAQIAERSDVIYLNRYTVPRRLDERQNQIVAGNLNGALPATGDYLNYLAQQGFTQAQFNASNFVVNISDSGVDNATTVPTHFGLYTNGNPANASRVAYNRLLGTPTGPNSTLQGCDGHGNINAHIIAGYVPTGAPYNAFPHADASGFRYGLGVAPFVKVGSSVIFDGNGSIFGDYTFPDFIQLESQAYDDGARISSNSWGSAPDGAYDFDAQTFDYLVRDSKPEGSSYEAPGNQQNVIVFAAGNSGPQAQTVAPPGSAKNVITAGASENVLAFGGADRCTTADSEADSANDMTIFSSRGPTADGRRKPDLVAPGTHITGGVFQINNPPANGQAAACYNAAAVCGGPPASPLFFPAGQQFYTASTGTSHSTPAIAGAAALVRQRFLNEGLPAPSPALTKAALINSARYLTGTYGNDALWSNTQGMGAVNLSAFFQSFVTPTMLRDQETVDLFTASGQMRTINGTISDPTKPLRVTLAWTDAPGGTAAAAWVNDLNLEVTAGGQTYKGNVFSGALSTTGGTADARNNVESVFLPAGVTGAFTVRVTAANIAGDAVFENGAALDQDFALVIFNMAEAVQPALAAAGSTVTNESCSPVNNALDPDETVTVNLTLANIGRAATSNLVATLQATGGVTAPSGPQNYGALAAHGAAVTRSFSFTATGACGGVITATLQLQDGATNLGTVAFDFTLGSTTLQTHTFSNTNSLSIPASGVASTYPSTINVSGLQGAITKVKVSLNGLNHTAPDDIDILLVAPDGRKMLLMSDCGGLADLVNVNLTFDDDAAQALPNTAQITAGTYTPTNFGIADTLQAPAPAGPYPDPQRLSTFNGAQPNGAWSLYVYDDLASNGGSLANGWSLELTILAPICCNSNCPAITIAPATLPAGTVGVAYNQSFTQSGGVNPVTFSLSGTLPSGVSFNNGALSGAPTQAGSFPLTVTATGADGCQGFRNYTLATSCHAVTSLVPNNGPPGTPVTINGSGFTGVTGVTFANSVNASFTFINDSQLQTSVPAGAVTGPLTISKTHCPALATPVFTVPSFVGPLSLFNAASYNTTEVAVESVVAAFGKRLAALLLGATTAPLPVTLGDTSVNVLDSAGTNRAAGIYFIAPDRVNLQIPASSAPGLATITVTNRCKLRQSRPACFPPTAAARAC
jgi:subtilisin-like proprotein convertase family protein